MNQLDEVLRNADIGELITLPGKDFNIALDLGNKDALELEIVNERAGQPVSITRDQSDHPLVLSFVTEVPDYLHKITVLDASAPISKLMQYDLRAMLHTEVVSIAQSRGINRLSDCAYGTHVGLVYRNDHELTATIAGQTGDLSYNVDPKELYDTQVSEHASQVYQALSRLACRHTLDGRAPKTDFWLFYPNDQIICQLRKVMPNFRLVEYKPKYLPRKKSAAILAETILKYVVLQPAVDRLSMTSIRKCAGVTEPTDTHVWADTLEILAERLPRIGWTRTDRSLKRL